MYQYDNFDQALVDERVAQFRDQTRRFLSGKLSEDEFRPLRLRNGLYIQTHAPMLRVAIPYGLLSADQLRMLAQISDKYDKGYGHFTTRQNIQYNWPELAKAPDILADLATVQMHAIQTSGNCIRNVTSDPLAGVAKDEIVDPRPYCEIIRQWSTFHPEFAYLPRKFKIAVYGATEDRAAVRVHDIGLQVLRNTDGALGFKVFVGGGLGRTPIIGKVVRAFLDETDLLTYLEAILRVYNLYGRRDNIYKSRIKILVKALGVEQFAQKVEEEWALLKDTGLKLTQDEIDRVSQYFVKPDYRPDAAEDKSHLEAVKKDAAFACWFETNVVDHQADGYKVVFVSLKKPGQAPGDATSEQMSFIADLAEQYSFGCARVTHEQNLVLSDVAQGDLVALWKSLDSKGLATPTMFKITDIICCPGLDFCSLANTVSIPVAKEIMEHFDDLDFVYELGALTLNISGCMNACGHHHVGNIGILGVDKKGKEFYQVSLGGRSDSQAELGKIVGPSFDRESIVGAIGTIIDVFVSHRRLDEMFIETYQRIGLEPFKDKLYASH